MTTRLTLDRPAGPIAALAAGAPEAQVVLLVPGFTGSKEDFAPILDPIAAAGLRAVAIDLPGQYESPGRGDFSVEALSVDVRDVAASLAARVHLVGHSFGGFVARAAAISEPARFLSVTLMDSGPFGIDGGRRDRINLLRPVLILTGTDDDAFPPDLQDAMAKRLGAEYFEVPDAAHSPAVENPTPTAAALIRFWQ
jgi:pimeloyl-ACP methyl ester carboxylesterase